MHVQRVIKTDKMPIDLTKIPEGTWIDRKNDTVIIGAFFRYKLGQNIFSWCIALAVLVPALYIVIPQIQTGETGLLLGGWTICFCTFALSFMTLRIIMSAFGHVEFKLEEGYGTIFYGVRRIGRTYKFTYAETKSIEAHEGVSSHGVITQFGITIKAEKTIMIAGYLQEKR